MKFKSVTQCLCVCAMVVWSVTLCRAAGTRSGNFLKLGMDAKALGMAGSYVAAADGASAMYWNPAGLAWLATKEVNIMYSSWYDEVNYQYLLFAMPSPLGSFGVGVERMDMGGIQETNTFGQDIGTYNPNNMVYMLSYAVKWETLSVGVTGKYIEATIKNSAATATVDIGVRKAFLDETLFIGITGQNLTGELRYHTDAQMLEKVYKIGACVLPMENVMGTLDVESNDCFNGHYVWAGGVQYSLDGIALRAGYTNRYSDVEAQGITCGVGFGLHNVRIDYAYVPLGILNASHYVSLSYGF